MIVEKYNHEHHAFPSHLYQSGKHDENENTSLTSNASMMCKYVHNVKMVMSILKW